MIMFLPKKSEWIILGLISLFILIRSIHFNDFFNFSYDQGFGAAHILEIWKNKDITLVGPGTSLIANSKPVLQGSIVYYFNLVFLLLGGWDPVKSSYFFMLFAAIMIIPLYLGIKLLINKKAALFIIVLYVLLPLFIDFTRFFFGPNFQLAILPILIFFMGAYQKYKKSIYLILVFITTGILLQFHYQFLIITVGLYAYYLLTQKQKAKILAISLVGFTIGFSPMIIFELKNNFYNIRVFSEYLLIPNKAADFALIPHRYLSLGLMLLIFISWFSRKKFNNKLIFIIGLLLFIFDLFIYLPQPKNAFGMAPYWNYLMEKKAYKIIADENIQNYNIVNMAYDNTGVVIKYLLKKDGHKINYEDYYHNDYLFVISKTNEIFDNPAYEVNTFKPNREIKKWNLNNYYNLYLFKRMNK